MSCENPTKVVLNDLPHAADAPLLGKYDVKCNIPESAIDWPGRCAGYPEMTAPTSKTREKWNMT
jgi:hypothetical protein